MEKYFFYSLSNGQFLIFEIENSSKEKNQKQFLATRISKIDQEDNITDIYFPEANNGS